MYRSEYTRRLLQLLTKICEYVTAEADSKPYCSPGLKHYFKPERANQSRFRERPDSLTLLVGRA